MTAKCQMFACKLLRETERSEWNTLIFVLVYFIYISVYCIDIIDYKNIKYLQIYIYLLILFLQQIIIYIIVCEADLYILMLDVSQSVSQLVYLV